jgi:hypothetical protein
MSRGTQPLLLLRKPDFFVGNPVLVEEFRFEGGKCALLNSGMYVLH